jgi:hypothetical protein
MHGLLETAYGEIAPAGGPTLDQRLGAAIKLLVSTPVPADPPQLEEGVMWKYADPKLEGLPAASKQFMRMGARNMKLIDDALKTFGDELHLTPAPVVADQPH